MNALKKMFQVSKSQVVVGTAVAVATLAPMSFAADGDIDFTTMIAGIAAAGTVTAIVAMGVVKLTPNFAKWAVNKVASFF